MRLGSIVLIMLIAFATGCSAKKKEARSTTFAFKTAGPIDSKGLGAAADVVRARLKRLGVRNGNVQPRSKELLITVPRPTPAGLIGAVEEQGVLELYGLETSLAPASRNADGDPLPATDLHRLLAKVRGGRARSGVPKGEVVLTCSSREVVCPGPRVSGGDEPPGRGRVFYYLAVHKPRLTGSDLKHGGTRSDFDPTTNEPVVLLQFTSAGSAKFRKLTADEFSRGRARLQRQHFAIVLDGEIRSFPQIDYQAADLAGGISAGNVEITGIRSVPEAKRLALVVRTGALPTRFVLAR